MRRTTVTFLVLACTTSLAVLAQGTLNSVEVARKVSRTIATINVQTDAGQVSGSGFVISPDGKIVTSLHVVRNMRKGSVQLSTGDIFDTFSVRAADERRDLAIIQISGFDLPAVDLGNSNEVQTGEPVLLFGSPRGLEGTVTSGVVSAIRNLPEGLTIIQTDASANPGNSGGPLINARAQAVGVLGFKLQNSVGLNFAVPINYVRGMLNNLSDRVDLSTATTELPKEASAHKVEHLRDVVKIAIESFGVSEAALLVREKLVNRLIKSNIVTVLDNPQAADGVLSGVVGQNVYGQADASVFRLRSSAGQVLWTEETSRRGLGSASSSIADKIADRLLDAIEKDRKTSRKGK